jgi:hypothetical protein
MNGAGLADEWTFHLTTLPMISPPSEPVASAGSASRLRHASRTIMAAMTWRRNGRFCFTIICVFTWAGAPGLSQAGTEEVVFESGGLQRHGFLWKPVGNGPFPAVLWNHRSEKIAGRAANPC